MAQERASTSKRGPYMCGRCGDVGHNTRNCTGPKILHRCLSCSALVRDADRHQHVFDHRERRGLSPKGLTDQDVAPWFTVALVPVFDEGGE